MTTQNANPLKETLYFRLDPPTWRMRVKTFFRSFATCALIKTMATVLIYFILDPYLESSGLKDLKAFLRMGLIGVQFMIWYDFIQHEQDRKGRMAVMRRVDSWTCGFVVLFVAFAIVILLGGFPITLAFLFLFVSGYVQAYIIVYMCETQRPRPNPTNFEDRVELIPI